MVEEEGSCHDDQAVQRVGSEGEEGAHVVPSHGPSGRSHYLIGLGCGPSAAHQASSSPLPLAGNYRHSRPA